MRATDLIRRKRDGGVLSSDDITTFLRGVTDGSIADYQASAMAMAIFFRGMSQDETVAWTMAMRDSGTVMVWDDLDGIPVDKHSTGGVGDKVSLILAPLVAAAGVPVPMISGRGLGHTGGTLDKLESIPGFRTDLSVARFRELVRTLGCGLIGQTAEIAPADKKLYALRDVTATVECIPLIVSSILSKKLAEGIDGLVLDVKWGSGAFMRTLEDAEQLAEALVQVGTGAGKQVVARLTDMNQPLGRMVGNALEVAESLDVLEGGGPADLREMTLELGAEMLVLGGVATALDEARARLGRLLDSGAARERFGQIIEAQHGDPRVLDDRSLLPTAPVRVPVLAESPGVLSGMDCAEVGRAASELGAGRARAEDVIDPAVGLEMHVRVGDAVAVGQPLATLHCVGGAASDAAVARFRSALRWSSSPTAPLPLFGRRISA
jgi:pyrimidine-nucleoside phosphorylase